MADTKAPYQGTTLVRFGDATEVTLGCNCGSGTDCDCQWREEGDVAIL